MTDYVFDLVDSYDYIDVSNTFESNPTDLTILHANIRGMGSKTLELKHLIDHCILNDTPE